MSSNIVIIEENQDPGFAINTRLNGDRGKFLAAAGEQELIIDRAAYNVYHLGDKISFPRKEFELLLLLASNPRKVFRRDEILKQIWGSDFKPKDSRSLDVHIRMLRKKLNSQFITTIRGVGYKLERE